MFFPNDKIFGFTDFQENLRLNHKNQNSTSHSNKNSIPKTTFNFELTYQTLTENIGKFLFKGIYLQEKSLLNPFCPLCLKIVQKNQNFTLCNIRLRSYIFHDWCLCQNPSFQMCLINNEEDEMLIIKKNHVVSLNERKNNKTISIKLSNRVFFIQITFLHPISEKFFWKIQKKININNSDDYFQLDFVEQSFQNQSLYLPNIYIFPLTDYLIDVKINEIGVDNKFKTKKYANFKKLFSQDEHEPIKFGNEEIQFCLKLHKTENSKNKIISNLNYKFKFIHSDIFTLQKLFIKMPDDLKQEESDDSDEFFEASSSKMIQMLEIDKKQTDEDISHTSQKTLKSNLSHESKYKGDNWSHRHYQIDEEKSLQSSQGDEKSKQRQKQKQKVSLDRLILNDTLKDFVKSNTQSRSFQHFLNRASNQQIHKIIECLKQEFVQLMKHEYGNYMMQKLFSVCNLQRRMLILQILISNLDSIIMNKQGTHAFQDFLSFLTTDSEYVIILNRIRTNFYELCVHNNATHFIQKIIKLFPFQLLQQFYCYSIQNLYQFGCDKNGMCVIKCMMKKLNESSIILLKNIDKVKADEMQQQIQEYKKMFVQGTLANLDGLIGDMYGNYVVQFNFEFFNSSLTLNLSDTLLMKLAQYSLSKYSTNVVYKCLNSYWSLKQMPHISLILKQVLQPYLIYEMYKNKDGNKILLQIMQKYEGYEIWGKLHGILIEIEPTRYYHDRWGVCFGIRSGNVGGKWNSFTQAVHRVKKINLKPKMQ